MKVPGPQLPFLEDLSCQRMRLYQEKPLHYQQTSGNETCFLWWKIKGGRQRACSLQTRPESLPPGLLGALKAEEEEAGPSILATARRLGLPQDTSLSQS